MEVWNEKALEKSEMVLNQFKEIADFVLIGGWAVYLLTKMIKSLDNNVAKLKSRLLAIIKESSEEYNYVFQQKIIPSKLKKIKTNLLDKFKVL